MTDVGRILDSLRPCPFCGGKAGRRFRSEGLGLPFECIIECSNCGASLKVEDIANDLNATQNLAIDKWNTRIESVYLPKKQEPILLENQHKPYGISTNANSPWISRCPKCGKKIEGKQTRFCKYCGQEVKWK